MKKKMKKHHGYIMCLFNLFAYLLCCCLLPPKLKGEEGKDGGDDLDFNDIDGNCFD